MASMYNSIKSAVRDAVSPTRQSRDNSRSRAANLDETIEKAGGGRDDSNERGRSDPRRSYGVGGAGNVGRTLSPSVERRSMSPAAASTAGADRGRRLSYGIGGVGNRGRTLSPSVDDHSPNSSRRTMSPFGRGGAGNQMRSTSQEAQERSMQLARDDEIKAMKHQEEQREGRTHYGRGGFANMRDRSESAQRSIPEETGSLESDETLAAAKSPPIVSTGRGGKGNIFHMSNAKSDGVTESHHQHHSYSGHTGRGGAGNFASTDGGVAADRDDDRAVRDAMAHTHIHHSGRGGAGNVFADSK